MTAIYRTTIRHARTAPVRHAFEYHSMSWLVDVADLPVLPRLLAPLAAFRAADHLEPAGAGPDTLRARVGALLAAHGLRAEGRVDALMNARALGYVFDPLTLYWCHDSADVLVAVIAEVHNTYGQRHSYVLRPDSDGHARVGKRFYVSPFHGVSGHYELDVPEPGERLAVRIVLHRDGHPPFVASMTGTRSPVTTRTLLAHTVRAPLAPLVVAARIRWQGLRLWARGVPITRRPDASKRREETVP
ncbi:DUF1365 domain-containing protein [Rhodococcus sp. HNM0569]|uniref:DUF1365 domain-containing protein n=1 Tax=Rhodococcus sp. HNM0569 TaxID=2716340 RepID=UPI00146A002B|nr:DUF1365 domain-containing protein [Rhodococcus sp. HNM0569]NLU84530.1 DUF1365 domain-containing protein [Rhodococcus sp. HNM0569]